MLLLLFSRQQNATPKYSRLCRRNETRTRTTHIIFADAISISSSTRRILSESRIQAPVRMLS